MRGHPAGQLHRTGRRAARAGARHEGVHREDVQDTITDLARQIDRDYADKDLLIVAVLKGAVMVVADLTRALHSHVELDFMAVSSYGSGT
ncbi:phosphoribosyltransferase, partial [Micrococcus luteus]|uniref:phosphoribosyltransferase n=1 Tax=Micrococcus luteus TaxID=1270 RepID=UPI0022B5A656